MPVREAEATNALIDAGCDVITCHVDGPKVVIETAEAPRRQDLRPQCQPGAARAEGLHHRRRIQVGDDLQDVRRRAGQGRAAAELRRRRLRQRHVCRTRAYGAGATPEAIAAADAAIADLKAGKPIYVGPLKDNAGKVVIEGTMDNYDPVLDGMNYLLEGVVGLDHLIRPARRPAAAARCIGASPRPATGSRHGSERVRRPSAGEADTEPPSSPQRRSTAAASTRASLGIGRSRASIPVVALVASAVLFSLFLLVLGKSPVDLLRA